MHCDYLLGELPHRTRNDLVISVQLIAGKEQGEVLLGLLFTFFPHILGQFAVTRDHV